MVYSLSVLGIEDDCELRMDEDPSTKRPIIENKVGIHGNNDCVISCYLMTCSHPLDEHLDYLENEECYDSSLL